MPIRAFCCHNSSVEGKTMQKVIYRTEIEKFKEQIDQTVINYLEEGLVETFEGFDHFNLVAFDWYDITDVEKDPAQMILYIDEDDFFVICENEGAYNAANKLFTEAPSNERAMYLFFKNLFKGDYKNIERIEDLISNLDDAVIDGSEQNSREKIVNYRYEILRLKKYYEQFRTVFEELCDNDNELISEQYISYFEVLQNRVEKMSSNVLNLREFIVQVRESYQAQIDIEQNRLMKVFTLVTSIFLPLTLIAGWYGMNLQMPEFGWAYGYPVVIGICVLVCLIWFIVFKKKGWFK